MKISVIVPVYKVEQYLHRCVQSILNQTFKDFELILVDDGSPDNSPTICDEYATKYNFVHVVHKENGGLSDARNYGIDWAFNNSDSEYITFIDSDDWIHPLFLEILHKTCIDYGVDVSCCGYNVVHDKLNDTALGQNAASVLTPEGYWCYSQSNAAIAWSKLYKKQLFIDVRFPKGFINEDEFTTHKVLFKCERVAIVDSKLYYYFVNIDSIMHQKWSLKNLVAFQAYKAQCDYFLEHNFIEAFRCSNRAYVWMIYYMFCEKCVVPKQYKKYKKTVLKEWRQNFKLYKKSEQLKNIKKFRWPFEFFYPIKVGLVDNLAETLKSGGFKAVVENIKKHKKLKKLQKSSLTYK